IHDFDVREDIGLREVGLLRLRRFISVRSERGDVNQPDNAIVDSGTGDNTSAVGVADEDNGAADPAYGFFCHRDVLGCCVEAVLRRNTLITLRLKRDDQLVETRTICPKSMGEYNAWFCFHIYLFLLAVSFVHFIVPGGSHSFRLASWSALKKTL